VQGIFSGETVFLAGHGPEERFTDAAGNGDCNRGAPVCHTKKLPDQIPIAHVLSSKLSGMRTRAEKLFKSISLGKSMEFSQGAARFWYDPIFQNAS
jgi:hypothetical protein